MAIDSNPPQPACASLRSRCSPPLAPVVATASAAAAAAGQVEWSGVDRVVAFADVHGAYAEVTALLQSVQVVDADLRWTGGKTHLVSLGDLLDRGDESRKVMDLLMRLQQEADGGRRPGARGARQPRNHERARRPALRGQGRVRRLCRGRGPGRARRAEGAVPGAAAGLDRRGLRAALSAGLLRPPPDARARGQVRRVAARRCPRRSSINDTVYMHGGPSTSLRGRSIEQLDADYSRGGRRATSPRSPSCARRG